MSGRTGRVARYTLRLGLLLCGVAIAWGAQGVASGPEALAADRQPSGPLTATALTHMPEVVTDATDPAGPVASPAPAPARAHATTGPVVPLRHERVTHGGGGVHSEAADADANRWRLPTLTHRYARPTADPLPPSRTSRPGTRPA